MICKAASDETGFFVAGRPAFVDHETHSDRHPWHKGILMFRLTFAVLIAVATFAATARSADDARGLDVYFIDTEGGAATLIVTPARESILIDNGNPGTRDAERIHKAATELAGLKAIDHMIITHWHSDHYGSTETVRRVCVTTG